MNWGEVKVVYIPKHILKKTRSSSRVLSSLTSFILKFMEKQIDRSIKDEVLLHHPLQNHQYAYQPGRSTTQVLQHLVDKKSKTMSIHEGRCNILLSRQRRCSDSPTQRDNQQFEWLDKSQFFFDYQWLSSRRSNVILGIVNCS